MSSKIDVLLISPSSAAFAEAQFKSLHTCLPPIGLGYLAAMIRSTYSTAIIDLGAKRMNRVDIMNYLNETQPRVVGITTTVGTYRNGLRVAAMVKEILPDTPVIMGGPQATFLPEETLNSGDVDVVCRYEGEYTMVELADYYLNHSGQKLEQIMGISFIRDEQVITTQQREFITDLDCLPYPAYDLLDIQQYGLQGYLNIVTGRGCPFNCKFCSANVYSGKRYRQRSLENVLHELRFVREKYGKNQFFIADDTFTYSKQRVLDFCQALVDQELYIDWQCEGRVNTVDYNLLKTMRERGCKIIQFGVESGNDDTLQKISKGISTTEIKNAVQAAYDLGLDVVCSIIIGLPDDTRDDVLKTLQFAQQLKNIQKPGSHNRVNLVFSVFTPLPGTYYYENAEESGIRFVSRDWDQYSFTNPVIATRYLQPDEIHNLFFEAQMIAKS